MQQSVETKITKKVTKDTIVARSSMANALGAHQSSFFPVWTCPGYNFKLEVTDRPLDKVKR